MGDNTRTINKHANTSYSIGNRNTDYTCCGYYLVSLQYILKAPYIRLDLCTKQGFFYYLQKRRLRGAHYLKNNDGNMWQEILTFGKFLLYCDIIILYYCFIIYNNI